MNADTSSVAGFANYTRTAIALHWLIALAVVVQFAWGWWMQTIPKEPPGMWGAKDAGLKDLFSAIHYAASWVLAGAVALHLAGVAKHALIDRDGVLGRMGLRI